MAEFNLAGYLIFVLITSITPGPNNYMLFTYGRTYGFNNANKLMTGILLGFFTMLYIAGYGVAEVITTNHTFGLILKIIGSIWMIYLAFVLSNLSSDISADKKTILGFTKGYMLQFVNPKAWIMAIAGAGAFMPQFTSIHLNVFVFAAIFSLVGIPCMIVWVFLGDYISRLLKSERANNIAGYIIFILMIVSVVTIWV
ncbi:MAG: LysE family translocator [Ignavibacteriaceae bacterium]